MDRKILRKRRKKSSRKGKQGKMYKETTNKRKKNAHGNAKTNKEGCTKKR